MFSQRHILILVSPGSLVGIDSSANDAASIRVPSATESADGSRQSLDPEALSELLVRMSAGKRPRITVIPTQGTEIVSLNNFAMGRSAAVEAASLAMLESQGGTDDPVADSHYVLDSRQAAGGRHTAVLTVTERESGLRRYQEWVEDAGAVLAGVLPARALVAASVAIHASIGKGTGMGTGVDSGTAKPDGRILTYIGEHVSTIARVEGGRVISVRTLAHGYSQLIEAVQRASERIDPTRRLSLADARVVIDVHGVPRPDAVIEPIIGLTGRHVLPLFQPILQRYALEIKQSVRAIGKNSEGVCCELFGPGAQIMGLPASLERSAGVSIVFDAQQCDTLGGPLAMYAAASPRLRDALTLLPSQVTKRRHVRTLQHSMIAGGVIAACVLGGESLLTMSQMSKIESQFAGYHQRLARIEQHDRQAELVNAVQTQVQSGQDLTVGAMGSRPVWSAVLGHVSAIIDSPIELVEIRGQERDGRSFLYLQGFVYHDIDEEPISELLELLAGVPGLSNVSLNAKQRIILNSKNATEFQIGASVQRVPQAALLERFIERRASFTSGTNGAETDPAGTTISDPISDGAQDVSAQRDASTPESGAKKEAASG